MNVITRINGRKIIPVSDSMQAIFPFGEIGFPCQLYHDNICNFHENNVNWHWQNELEFSVIKKGRIELQFPENKHIVKKDEGYLIFPNHMHKIIKISNHEGVYDTIIADPSIIYGRQPSIIYHKYYTPVCLEANGILFFSKHTDWGAEVFKLLASIAKILEEKPDYYEITISQYFSMLWKLILDNTKLSNLTSSNTPYTKNIEKKIRNMLAYIHENYSHPISLNDIASIGNIGRSECCQLFKKYVHTTPIGYLIKYRIEKSISLLLKDDSTITDIAFDVGFNCINHYINTFKKITGTTPYHYKRNILDLNTQAIHV
uniref:HTH araC/xylS-type domain-containing protein n=1 Tax=Eubacterium plexicaudatum ASF492 TaxID=1235802 RepID=N2AF66_9FIRM